jgi:hypothetical protein
MLALDGPGLVSKIKKRGLRQVANIYPEVTTPRNVLTSECRIYTKKTRYIARSMKTKALSSRYPRKISFLKDLQRGYPGADLLRKSMKTSYKLEIPSKRTC